jgi:hypothetical protein
METSLVEIMFLVIACGLAFQAYKNNQEARKTKRKHH